MRLRRRLIRWYREHHRHLPWREAAAPYGIWVSEVMLQQTQVATVVPYYHRFMERFPDVASLAAADLQDVLKCWEGLGYYARARNLHQAARRVAADHGGRVPESWEALRGLPGVGDYIASAILSLAFGKPYAVVDGNVKRVLARLELLEDPVNRPGAHRLFQGAADRLLDPRDPGQFNQALMELGALVCRPAQALCVQCPLTPFCRAHAECRADAYPRREKRRAAPLYRIAVGVVREGDRVLITRRAPEGLLGGLWEFPGGKIGAGETPEAACVREIREEVGLAVDVIGLLAQVRHAYTHFRIAAEVFLCSRRSGAVTLDGPVDHRWVTMGEIDAFAFPRANHKFIPELRRRMAGGVPGRPERGTP